MVNHGIHLYKNVYICGDHFVTGTFSTQRQWNFLKMEVLGFWLKFLQVEKL